MVNGVTRLDLVGMVILVRLVPRLTGQGPDAQGDGDVQWVGLHQNHVHRIDGDIRSRPNDDAQVRLCQSRRPRARS